MTSIEKIYSDDPLLRYKETDVNALRSKSQIDGVLAEYGTKDVWWHWEKEAVEKKEPADIYVSFQVEEVIEGLLVKVAVKVPCPVIWDRANSRARIPENRIEKVNWDTSMRAMYHFIYTHMNSAYAMRSSKTLAFLGYVRTGRNQQIKDIVIPRLGSDYKALIDETPQDRRPIEG